jgi:hypothetical protein
MEQLEGRAQIWPGSGSDMAKAVEAGGLTISMAKDVADLNKEADLRAKIAKVFSE